MHTNHFYTTNVPLNTGGTYNASGYIHNTAGSIYSDTVTSSMPYFNESEFKILSLIKKQINSMTENEKKLIENKIDYLIENNKIKIKIDINDEEKI